jgi:hypothetical protein
LFAVTPIVQSAPTIASSNIIPNGSGPNFPLLIPCQPDRPGAAMIRESMLHGAPAPCCGAGGWRDSSRE